MSRENDQEILSLCFPAGRQEGTPPSDAGFRRLYDQHAARVRSIMFRVAGPEELNDVVQEAFVKIWTALPGFKGDCALSTWIYRVALNAARDYRRARRRRWWLNFFGEPGDVDERKDPHDQEANWQHRQDLARAIDRLSPKLRDVVVLFSLQELDIEEVAAILEIPPGTVKSRLHQARHSLRGFLEETREAYG